MANQHRIGSHRTTVRNLGGNLTVTYHSTAVVQTRGNRVVLDSGGWRSSTTKTRMNQTANAHGLGFRVYAKAGVWYVQTAKGVLAFRDGMTFARG